MSVRKGEGTVNLLDDLPIDSHVRKEFDHLAQKVWEQEGLTATGLAAILGELSRLTFYCRENMIHKAGDKLLP